MFGLRFMGTLLGIVFLSHQLGSFTGVWLGGVLYDRTGSYEAMWWAGVCLGLFAAIVHLPINDRPLARLSMARGRRLAEPSSLSRSAATLASTYCPAVSMTMPASQGSYSWARTSRHVGSW